jgi:hypothetical protein
MSAFEIVLIVVGVVGLLIACTRYFRPGNAVNQLGESPQGFAHPGDQPISERPSEDTRDRPVPKRPARGRA